MVSFLRAKTDDYELVRQLKDNDQQALELLYINYSRKIFYFSLKYLQNKAEAEDLVQTIFINLWEHRAFLDPNLPVKSYIFRSATNLIYNCIKRRAIRSRYIEYELSRSDRQSNQTYDTVYLHDLEKSISEIITSLPPQQQRIFKMSRNNGYSYEMIAQKLDISVRTVENQIYRTLKVIRKSLMI
jgi:RNA polymerase sigma-70 factor (ECF subfamily)